MHSDQLEAIMGKDMNLCTYFILPLIELNKFRFGPASNFLDSYVNMENKQVVVKLVEGDFIVQSTIRHPNYVNYYHKDDHYFIVYSIPELFHAELELYRNGKYSRFKEVAKELIRVHSGLGYKEQIDGREATDVRLLALEKSPILRKAMNEHFGTSLGPRDELLSVPKEDSFI